MNKDRLEGFSDGVYAIVITLLVLDIKIPSVSYANLENELIKIIPNILAYIISFAIVGVYWMGHAYYFSFVKKSDGTFAWLNILSLLLVAFLPFPTSLIGEYPFETIPILIYGSTLLAINIVSLTMVLYLSHHKELAIEESIDKQINTFIKLFTIINFIYLIGIVISFFYPVLSFEIYIAVLVYVIYIYARRS